MEPPRPDEHTPGNAGEFRAPSRPDAGEIWTSRDWTEPIPRKGGPRLLALFVALTVALSAIGAGVVVVTRAFHPLGEAADHRFLARRFDGSPTRWNPCEPIHYVVNPGRAPSGSVSDVHEAVRRISSATGIEFVYDGLTTEQLTRARRPYVPALYPGRWAPVLVAWVDPDSSRIPFEHKGDVAAALARPMASSASQDVYVSGWIAMNLDDPNAPGWSSPGAQGPTLLHEFGHIMGLGHVKTPTQLMHPAGGFVTDLGPGDREGLRLLGHEMGCLTTPEPGF
jgi:hypothetical protein